MWKTLLSVIAGYAALAVLTIALFGVLAIAAPASFGGEPSAAPGTGATLVILAFGLIAAVLGGWVTARLAPRRPWRHVLALAGLVLLLSVVSALASPESSAPGWYQTGLALVGVCGALLGGRLWIAS